MMLPMHDPVLKPIVGIVPIRGGSKGFPGKNIHPFSGEPLFLRAVNQALRHADCCILTTDIEEVLSAPVPEGCILLRRPAELAADETPMAPVLQHALTATGHRIGTALLLQATSPLRTDADVASAFERMGSGDHDLVLSVCAADRGILKYGLLEGNRFEPVMRPDFCFTNRQDLPAVFRPNGAVYVFDIAKFLARGTLASSRIGAIVMPEERSIDIDTHDDLVRAERLLGVAMRTIGAPSDVTGGNP